MKLSTRLILYFVLLSAIPLAVVGYLAYTTSRQTIEQNTLSRLVATTIFKQAEFNRWLNSTGQQLRQVASRPLVKEYALALTGTDPASPVYKTNYRRLLQDHLQPTVTEKVGFLELSLLDGDTGIILVSTNAELEGLERRNEAYFKEGQHGTFADSVRPAPGQDQGLLHISTPVKDAAGRTTAVLVGHADIAVMSEIIGQESGLNPTEESYLVNKFSYFVTNPKLGGELALTESAHTVGIDTCLAGQNGVGFYEGYRGAPVIGAFQWMPERELCLLTEIDQAEAFAPITRLRSTLFGIGGLIALLVALLGVLFARTITWPLEQLVTATREFSQGNLDYKVNTNRSDELGRLTAAFNQMIAQRKESELVLKEQQAFLQSIYQGVELSIFVVDVTETGGFRMAGLNPAHERISGMKSDEIRGRTLAELAPFVPVDSIRTIQANFTRCLAAGQSIEYEEMIPMGGREIWWLTKLIPVRNDAERIHRIIGTAMEITGRKQMEDELRRAHDELEQRVRDRTAALQESEAKYRQLAETAQDIIITHTMTGQITYVNPVGINLSGYNDTELRQMSVVELAPPETLEAMQGRREERAAGHSAVYRYETELLTKSGERVPLEVVSSLLNQDHRPSGILLLARDISARKEAELALQKSEEKYRTLFETMTQGIVYQDADGAIIDANPAAERILGLSLAQMQGRTSIDPRWRAIQQDGSDFLGETHPAMLALKTGQAVGDVIMGVFQPEQQTYHWININAVPQFRAGEAKPYQVYAIFEDVTKRRQAEEALRESERTLSTLMSNLPGMAYRCRNDEAWSMEFVSEGCLELTGYRPAALVENQTMAYGQLIHPDDQAKVWQQVQAAVSHQTPFDLSYRLIAADGAEKWLWEKGRGVFTEDGALLALEGFITDITRQKHAEEALVEQADNLTRSNADLQQFAYVASHDLQEPLRMISSYLQLIELRYNDRLDEDGREFIAYAVDGANRMKTLINDLLTYSRVGTRGEIKEPVDTELILKQVLNDLQFAIEDNGALISYDRLPTVQADRRQIGQLLQNLISNSLKFRNEHRPAIHISARRQHKEWLFSVRDNGIGLEPEFNERIFVIFQRLHNIEDYPGTGMGLAICKKIVERHGGRIWVDSQPGQGATFYFTLPIADKKEL